MDYEEALKIANSIITRTVEFTGYTDFLSDDWDDFVQSLRRLIAEELLNSFRFGTKW